VAHEKAFSSSQQRLSRKINYRKEMLNDSTFEKNALLTWIMR
jgi:hypothetical protein